MAEFETRSIYIDLKGSWPNTLFDEASSAVAKFMDDVGHDGVGEAYLSEQGNSYAYDAGYPSDMLLEPLINVLRKGPAWTIRIEEGDETGVSTHVGGPDVSPETVILGDIADPPVPLSRIDDKAYVDNLRAARAVEEMQFSILPT